jgi:hypothetical protein
MAIASKAVGQYLARYAEAEADRLPACLHHDRAMVLPAYREDWQSIRSALRAIEEDFLLILVVNAPAADPQTQALMADVCRSATRAVQRGNLHYLQLSEPFDVLLVDRCSDGNTISPRQGVGLARKIGADIALALIHGGHVTSPLIYSTDADVILPRGYFDHVPPTTDTAAILFPFRHTAPASIATASLLYEISLLYYTLGLKMAGSPYGYLSIGSVLAVDASHYAGVRGFPRRNAGEDFYLLNKLAKTGRIVQLQGPVIDIEARVSDRVPFGTGPGIRKILALASPVDDFRFYHPDIFDRLAALLRWLDHAASIANPPVDDRFIESYIDASHLRPLIAETRQRTTHPAACKRAMTDWFDGFQTMKFVHFMRDRFYPSLPLAALTDSPLLPPIAVTPANLPAIRDALAQRCFAPQEHRSDISSSHDGADRASGPSWPGEESSRMHGKTRAP